MHKNRFFYNLWINLNVSIRYFKIQIQKTFNFFEVQKESFFCFIKKGLRIELEQKKNWFQASKLDWTFNSQTVCFEIPIQNYQETIRFKDTYRTRVFIPIIFYNCKKQKLFFEWRKIGNLPILTQQGYFIINGSYRVCITQILHGAGVYKSRKFNIAKKVVFYVDFVPKQGRWVRIEKDLENLIWLCIKKELRIIIKFIFNRIYWDKFFININIFPKNNYKFISPTKQHFKKIQFKHTAQKFLISTFSYFKNQKARILYFVHKFLNYQIYDISNIGRKRINKCFNQNLLLSVRCLIPTDFIRAIFELNKLSKRKITKRFDDFDNLRIRQICAVGILLQKEIGIQIKFKKLNSFFYNFKRHINECTFIESFNNRIHRFITKNPLFHFADQVNPLSELTQKRRLTGLENNGLNISTRNKKVRNIHPSHFGRICPIETPEGKFSGLVNSPTISRRIENNNFIQSIIILKQNNWIQNTIEQIKLKPLRKISVIQRKNNWITRLSIDLLKDIVSKFEYNKYLITFKIDLNNLFFTNYVQIVSLKLVQNLALGSNLVPFTQNNDGNRVLMRTNIFRQSFSTIKFLSSRIFSSIETFIIYNADQNLYICWPGIVIFVDSKKVMIQSEIFDYFIVYFHKTLKQSFLKKNKNNKLRTCILFYFTSFYYKRYFVQIFLLTYFFGCFFHTNQFTISIQYPCVKKSKWVKIGDFLGDGKASIFGYFSIGQNIFIGYIIWDGLNFEDGVVTTEQLIIKDTFTSVHIEKWNVCLKNKKIVFVSLLQKMFFHNQIIEKYAFSYYFETLDTFGFIKVGSIIISNQVLILRIRMFKISINTHYNRLIADVFNLEIFIFTISDVSFHIPNSIIGRILNVDRFYIYKLIFFAKTYWKNLLNWNLYCFKKKIKKKYTIQTNRIIKFTCRFNFISQKFIISIIIDKIFKYINFCCKITYLYPKIKLLKNFNFFVFQQKLKNINKNNIYIIFHTIRNFVRVYVIIGITFRIQIGDKLARRHGNKGILTRLIPFSEIPFFLNGVSLDIILNPLGVPSRINIGQIYEILLRLSGFFLGEQYLFFGFNKKKNNDMIFRSLVFEKLRIFSKKVFCFWIFNPKNQGKFYFVDGQTCQFIEKSIIIGESYIFKLVHIVDKKIYVRRIGLYSFITQQPVRGKSRIGGQRIGEIEIWALERCGASFILQEIFTVKSDDIINRGFKLFYFLNANKNIVFEIPETFYVLTYELIAVSVFFII